MHTTTTVYPSRSPAILLSRSVMCLLPGLAISGALAAVGRAIGHINWLQDHGFSALTLAIVLGMLVGYTVYPRFAATSGAGANFSKQNLLRLGVVLYALRLTVQDIGHVGFADVLTDALVLGSTFALACLVGIQWLGMDSKTAVLLGAGSSICGAAAVMAAEPVVKARAEQVTVAVATVVVFGTWPFSCTPSCFSSTSNGNWCQVAPMDLEFTLARPFTRWLRSLQQHARSVPLQQIPPSLQKWFAS